MNPKFTHVENARMEDETFKINLLMIRYNVLLEQIREIFNVNEEQMAILRAEILNRDYLIGGGDDE